MITDKLLQNVVAHLDSEITQLAVGTGAITEVDTTLQNELVRKTPDTFIDGNTIVKEIYFDENEVNDITLTNAGVVGEGANENPGSGTLFGGGVISITKDRTQSLTVVIETTVERA